MASLECVMEIHAAAGIGGNRAWNGFAGAPAKAHLFGLPAMWPIWIGLGAAIIKVTGKDLSGYVSCGVAARQF